jgi:hypothetical protein
MLVGTLWDFMLKLKSQLKYQEILALLTNFLSYLGSITDGG